MSGTSVWRRQEVSLLLAVLCVAVLTGILDSQHNYWRNPQASGVDLVRQWSMLGLYALGAAVVIIAGGIDLSAGSVIAFSGTICAVLLLWLAPDAMTRSEPIPLWAVITAITGTLLVGFLIGSLHAWLITAVGLPPFVATLATLVGLRSLARAICESVTLATLGGSSTQIQIFDRSFRYLATSVWIPAVLLIVLSIVLWILLSRTVLGRHLYALGGNEQAARLSGIQTDRLKWVAYCFSAMLSSIAGILYICEQSVADPQTLGRGYELNAIAAAVVGGCSLQGGVGTVPGTLLGALFLRTVIDGVSKIIKAGADVYEGLIVGVVVVFAVTFTAAADASGRRRKLLDGALGWVTVLNLTLLAGGLSALIGIRLLEGTLRMDATWLATIAMAASAIWLLCLRQAWTAATLRRVGIAMAIATILAVIGLDQAYPGIQQSAAMRSVSRAGGKVVRNDAGIVVDLTNAAMTDADLKSLAARWRHLKPLTEVRLAGTNITDRSVDLLTRVPGLARLDVSRTQFTPAGAQRLTRTLRQTQVVADQLRKP